MLGARKRSGKKKNLNEQKKKKKKKKTKTQKKTQEKIGVTRVDTIGDAA